MSLTFYGGKSASNKKYFQKAYLHILLHITITITKNIAAIVENQMFYSLFFFKFYIYNCLFPFYYD